MKCKAVPNLKSQGVTIPYILFESQTYNTLHFIRKRLSVSYRKAFSKVYRRRFELIKKSHVSLKKNYAPGDCNSEIYGDLVY